MEAHAFLVHRVGKVTVGTLLSTPICPTCNVLSDAWISIRVPSQCATSMWSVIYSGYGVCLG